MAYRTRPAVWWMSSFFHDAGAVRFGGLHPDAQEPRNFLGGLPLRDELQDLPFARRERVGRPYACSTSNVPVSSAFHVVVVDRCDLRRNLFSAHRREQAGLNDALRPLHPQAGPVLPQVRDQLAKYTIAPAARGGRSSAGTLAYVGRDGWH